MAVIELYLQRSELEGELASDIDIFFPDGGDVLRPDVSFILPENRHIIIDHIHGAPDLICGVLSDSTRDRDLGIKADRYLLNGVKEYWLLDPSDKSIQLWVNRVTTWEKKTGMILQSTLLPGLEITSEDIYTGMPG